MALTPSQMIIMAANAEKTITDTLGRTLKVRRLGALDRARIFKAVGAMHAQNAPYIGMAMIACSCMSVDGVPLPYPTRESEVDAAIARLDDAGMEAIAGALVEDEIEKLDGETADATAGAAATPAPEAAAA